MCSPKMPSPPDPAATAAAQTGTNVSTATANTWLGNVNQVTPSGSLSFEQTGKQFVPDQNGQTWYVDGQGQYTQTRPPGTAATGGTPGTAGTSPGAITSPGTLLDSMKTGTPGTPGTPGSSALPDGWTEQNGYYVPTFTSTTTLSPEEQAIFDSSQTARQNLSGTAADQSAFLREYLGQRPGQEGLPQAGQMPEPGRVRTSYGPKDGYAENVAAVQEALMSRLNPQIEQDRAALQARLANQGISAGSEAYGRETGLQEQNVNDARMQALLAAGQEQSRLAGLDQAQAGFQNAAQQQKFGQGTSLFDMQNRLRDTGMREQFAYRNQPINEITALLSGGQVQSPQFAQTQGSQMPTVDYAGLVNQNYNQQLAQWQQQQAQMGGLFGTLGSLGAAGIMASDRRIKRDVRALGGGRYAFRYSFDPAGVERFGVMADEHPEATVDGSGSLAEALSGVEAPALVDYARVA